MNILVCISGAFFPYLMVMLASLYDHHRGCAVDVYVMHSELREEDIALIREQAAQHGGRIFPVFVDASKTRIASLPTKKQWPHVLYYRLLAMDLLPETLDRILSLDVDIIVRGTLLPMYDAPMADDYLAACEDILNNTSAYKRGIHMPLENTYFNAGVMLLNLKGMRKDRISFRTFWDYIERWGKDLSVPDQDILNLALSSRLKLFPALSYNCSPELYQQYIQASETPAGSDATVIHYWRADCKPWDTYVATVDSYLQRLWWDYAAQTPFGAQLRQAFDGKALHTLVKQNLALKNYYKNALLWMRTKNIQARLEEYLESRGYSKIAIYGLNSFQEILCELLEGSRITVEFLIDSYATGYANGFEVKNGSRFESIDAIIIAAFAHKHEIRRGLEDACPVLSLDSILQELQNVKRDW